MSIHSTGLSFHCGDLSRVKWRRNLKVRQGDPRITCLCRQTSWAPRPVQWPPRHPRCVCEIPPPSARPACPRRRPGHPEGKDAGWAEDTRQALWLRACDRGPTAHRPGNSQTGPVGPQPTATGNTGAGTRGEGAQSLVCWGWGGGVSRAGIRAGKVRGGHK